MITTNVYGYGAYWNDKDYCWRFSDNEEIVDCCTKQKRTCKKCGLRPTKDGYDACVGFIPNAISACCGHGIEQPFIMYDDKTILFETIEEMKDHIR